MSSNQKPVPQAPQQQARCYQPAPYPQYTFQNQNKHVKIGADGGYHVPSPSGNYGPQQGPPQQQPLAMRASGMPPSGPPNQPSTPPQQTDGMKVPQMPTPGGNMQMTFLQPATSVRGNPGPYWSRTQMQAPNRNPSHHRQSQHVFSPMPMYTPLTPPVLLPNNMTYQQSYTPRQSGYMMYSPQISTQPNFINYPSQGQPFYFPPQTPAPPPLNIQRPGPAPPSSTGQQVPNQQTVSMPLAPPHMQPPTVSKKTMRKNALRIIDPNTGEDKSIEIYGETEFPSPDSGDSSARETPQPEVHMDVVPPEYAKITMQRGDVIISDIDHRTDVSLPEGLVHPEEILQTDGGLNTKLLKKIEILSPSESKLQAGTKEFIPVEAMKCAPPGPPRETPVVSASAGIEVIVCSKSSKERESPAKIRRANAQRNNETNVQRDLNLVQSVPVLPENDASRDIPLQLANASMSQPIIIDNKQIPLEQIYQPDAQVSAPVNILLKEHVQIPPPLMQIPPPHLQQVPIIPVSMNIPPPQIPIQIPPQHIAPVMTQDVNSTKDVPVHHSETTLTSKAKQPAKAKTVSDPNFVEAAKNPVPNNAYTKWNNNAPPPQVEPTHGNKNKATENKKSISNKDTTKPSAPSATTSTPAPNQKQPPPATTPAVTVPAPAAAGPVPPVPASQPPKASNKTNKMREINRKGADKEGTDMDAFSTNDNASEVNVNNNSAPAPISDNKTPVSTITPNVKTESTEPSSKTYIKSIPSNKQKGGDVCSIVKDVSKPVPKPAPTQVSNKEADNKLSTDTDKLVQAKNEANSKASMVNNVNNNTIETAKSAPSSQTKLPYKQDQWTPWNPSGKKVYDRDFLFALQSVPQSNIKPEYIPAEIEIENKDAKLQRQADTTRYGSMRGGHDNLFPFPKSSSHRGPALPNRKSLQKPTGGKPGGKPNVIHVSLSLREDIKLNETENAWKPARLGKTGEKLTEEEAKTADLYKKVRGILNKLTPQKFETLVSQVRLLNIDNTQRLQGVIDLVFEKAVDEPNYAVAYAYMCREVALMQVPAGPKEGNKEVEYVNFRKLLITRCQMEFENNYVDEEARNKKLKEIKECTNPDKRKELEIVLEEDDRRDRLKSVGNVKFIGELFKQQMLTAKIMVRCLEKLVDTIEEESLECLCKLLITTGKDLEIEKGVNLDAYFDKMQNIVNTKRDKISSRVRFMLQDVIELRKNKWVPRRQDNNPTTMDQIQKDAENEQLTIQINNSQPLNTPRKDDRMNSQGGKRPKNQTTEDGWQVQTRRPQAFTVESSKLKVTKPMPIGSEKLGGSHTFSKWNQGASTGKPNEIAHQMTNSFAALDMVVDNERDRRYGSGIRNGSKDAYSSKGPSMERYSNRYFDAGRGSRSGSQARSRDGSQARQQIPSSMPSLPPMAAPTPVAAQPKPASVPAPVEVPPCANLEKSTMQILNSYLEELNLSLSSDELRRTIPERDLEKFVSTCYVNTLEKNSATRLSTGKFIALLLQTQVISLSAVLEGLREVFGLIDDFIIDIPKIWEYFSELIAPLLAEGVLSLKVLKETMYDTQAVSLKPTDERYPGDGPGKLLVTVVNLLKKEKTPSFVRNLWTQSNCIVADFVPKKKVDSFVKEHQLEFLTDSSTPITPSTEETLQGPEITNKILEFLKNDTEFNIITEWVAANVGEAQAGQKTFIRALVTAICKYSINNTKLDENLLTKHANLIHRYVDHQPERELQALYALQAYNMQLEHPAGLLLQVCNVLWDKTSVISTQGFLHWEAHKDTADIPGKAVALLSLHSFLAALREEDTSNSENEADVDGK